MKVDDLVSLQKARVLVIGDIMLDRYVWGTVGRISPEAPVQVVSAQKKTATLGGAANVANNIAKLGGKVSVLGLRGNDRAGEVLLSLLKENGIDNHLIVTNGRPTITKTRIMAHGQQLLRIDEEQLNELTPDTETRLIAALEDHLNGVDAVIISDYAKGTLTQKICSVIIAKAGQREIPVIVDPKGTQWDKYRGASCITPNTSEFSAMTPSLIDSEKHLVTHAEELRKEMQADALLITRGPEGMVLILPDSDAIFIPSDAREVFDVSGAGDTVVATLALALAGGFSWMEAVKLANMAAGIVVGKLGTQPVMYEELQDELLKTSVEHKDGYDDIEEALKLVKYWRSKHENIVFTNGCFDLLHVGHIKLIEGAAREGDRLIVGLNSDDSVRRLKGEQRPIITQKERARLLSAVAGVDMVVIFHEDTPINLIEKLRPDVLVKGSDYSLDEVVGGDLVSDYGGRVALVELEHGYSTTAIVQKITS